MELKEFKKKVKEIDKDYKVKSYIMSGFSRDHRKVEVFYNGKRILGGGDVTTEKKINEHKKLFEFFREVKGWVVDEDGDRVIM